MNLLSEDFDAIQALKPPITAWATVRLKPLPPGFGSYARWHNSLTDDVPWTGYMDIFREKTLTVFRMACGFDDNAGKIIWIKDQANANWYIHIDMLEVV